MNYWKKISSIIPTYVVTLLLIVIVLSPVIYTQGQQVLQNTCPVRGGTLVIIYWGEPKSWNPDSQVDDALNGINPSIFNRLVALDYAYNVIPDLAESWSMDPNATEFVFHLRRNVTWHDGTPFTCRDVKWTFEAIRKFKGIAYSNLKMSSLQEVVCVDDYTVRFIYNESFPAFISFLAWYGTWILPEHIYNKTEYSDWMDPSIPALQRPIGTGPFKFVEYVKGSHIVLEANENYFKGRPCVDRVVYKIVPDPTSAEQTFLAGEGDVLQNPPPISDIPLLNKTPGIIVKTLPTLSRYYIGFNMLKPLFQDYNFRLAIALSIDRDELNQKAYNGYAFPATTAWLPGMAAWWNPNATLPQYNPEKAKQILDELGFKVGPDGYRSLPNGTPLELRLLVFQGSTSEAIGQVLKEQLRRIGLKVSLEVYEIATWETKVVKNRDFDIALCDGFHGPDPHNMYMRYAGFAYINFANYSNPEFDRLVVEGSRTADPNLRRELYFKAQEIFASDLVYIPLLDLPAFFIYREGWNNMPWDLIGMEPINSWLRAWFGASLTTTVTTSQTTPTTPSPTTQSMTPATQTTSPQTTVAVSPTSTPVSPGLNITIIGFAVGILVLVVLIAVFFVVKRGRK
ncbi:MAG: ABC transporter substrate-binding protein [Desulfurococcaceae archaeon]